MVVRHWPPESTDIRIVSAIVLIAALKFSLAACGGERNSVTGTIIFDGDLAIPAGTVLIVELRNVSRQDAPSTLIASQTIKEPKRFPLEFAEPYEPDGIDPRATYRVQVSATLDIRLIYANDTAFHVLTDGNRIRGVGM